MSRRRAVGLYRAAGGVPLITEPEPEPAPNPDAVPTLTLSFTTSRDNASGTAASGAGPLGLFCDATATKILSPGANIFSFFHVRYLWDFGDPHAGVSPVTGGHCSRMGPGPLAAHVYTVPGVYALTCTASYNGYTTTATRLVMVEDPNQVFAGTATVLVAPDGDFSGSGISGAEERTTLPTSWSGKRVLVQRASTALATTDIRIPKDAVNFQLGAFGIGAKPQVGQIHIGGLGASVERPDTGVVWGLDGRTLTMWQSFNHITVHDMRFTRIPSEWVTSVIDFGSSPVPTGLADPATWRLQEHLLVSRTYARGDTGNDGNPNITAMGFMFKSALIDCDFDEADEHTLRCFGFYKMLIARPRFGGRHHIDQGDVGMRHAIKIQSSGEAIYSGFAGTAGYATRSQYGVLQDSLVGHPDFPGSWIGGFAPENANAGYIQPVQWVRVSNVGFIYGPHTGQALHNVGSYLFFEGLYRSPDGSWGDTGLPVTVHNVTRAEWVEARLSAQTDTVPWNDEDYDPRMDAYLDPYLGQFTGGIQEG